MNNFSSFIKKCKTVTMYRPYNMRLTVLTVIYGFCCLIASASAPKITLLDHYDQTADGMTQPTISYNSNVGHVVEKAAFAASKFGNGLLCSNAADKVVYPAEGHVNPHQGTIELWVEPTFNLADAKSNKQLLRVAYDKSNIISLMYNHENGGLVFYMVDKDTPSDFYHSPSYPILLPSERIFWKAGERHHITVTWQRDVQRIYIDGRYSRHSFFCGEMTIPEGTSGSLIVGRDSDFVIDELRVWDAPRAPRNIDKRPSASDENSFFPTIKPALPQGGERIETKMCNVVLSTNNLPIALYTGPTLTSRLWAPARIDIQPVSGGLIPTYSLKWFKEKECIVGEIKLINQDQKQSVTADLSIILPALQPDDYIFMAADDCPFSLEKGRPFYDGSKRVSYTGDACLPMVTVYSKNNDEGFTLFSSEDTLEEITYDMGYDGAPNELRVTHRNLVVPPGGTLVRRLFLTGHEGDWRCGLAAYAQQFPSILSQPQGPIAKGDQGMIIGGPSTPEFLKNIQAVGIGWREVSLYLGKGAGFGNYIPDNLEPYTKTINGYRTNIVDMLKHDISPLMYIQARECKDTNRATNEFSDSVVIGANGKPKINKFGPFGATMTCRPNTAWYMHLLEQARREMETFPNAHGFFFDNAWRTEYSDILCAIADYAHATGKSLAANGGNAHTAGNSDSIMAESYYTALGTLQYLGLVTPVTYIPIYSHGALAGKEREFRAPAKPVNMLCDLKECLLSGAFYSLNYRGTKYWTAESQDLFEQYLPLQNNLKGRKWYLQAHALNVPENIRANIFKNERGELITYLVSDESSFRGEKLKPFKVSIRVPKRGVNSVVIRRIEDSTETTIPFKTNGDRIEITVINHSSITMLKIKL